MKADGDLSRSVVLLDATGSLIHLPASGILTLGRQNVLNMSGRAVANVSRIQCEVTSIRSGATFQRSVLVTSKSRQNPTCILRTCTAGLHMQETLLLHEGDSVEAHIGDRILLVATHPDSYLEVAAAPTAQQMQQSNASNKRRRVNPESDSTNYTHSTAETQSTSQACEQTAQNAQNREPSAAAQSKESAVASETCEAEMHTTISTKTVEPASLSLAAGPAEVIHSASQADAVDASPVSAAAVAASVAAVGEGNADKSKAAVPVMLLLSGPPGSGKSTFCGKLSAQSPVAWSRVNQDSINAGRRGSRQQCLAAARQALQAGLCCAIDRCHQDAQQRSDFIQLAQGLHLEVHVVVLALPAKVSAARAAARVQHEGGVQGPSAFRVSQMMHSQISKAGPPTIAEGLASIMMCHRDADVRMALKAWAAYGPPAVHPPDLFVPANPLKQAFGLMGSAAATSPPAAKVSPAAATSAKSADQSENAHDLHRAEHSPGAGPLPLTEASDTAAQLPGAGLLTDATLIGKGLPGSTQPQVSAGALSNAKPTAGSGLLATAGPSSKAGQAKSADATAGAGLLAGAVPSRRADPSGAAPQQTQNAFSMLMRAAKQPAQLDTQLAAVVTNSASSVAAARRPAQGLTASWQNALQQVALDPEGHRSQYPEIQVHDDCVVINDAYPKAQHHGLVIARQAGLKGPANLTSEHLPLLQSMQAAAEAYIRGTACKASAFRMGFHSIPSMTQLHMHVISQDFNSPCVKHKKHWNSFTSAFFLHLSDVIEQLSDNGRVKIDVQAAETMLKQDLHCHVCLQRVKNMPTLKAHILTHCNG